jgi:hypothetical protein
LWASATTQKNDDMAEKDAKYVREADEKCEASVKAAHLKHAGRVEEAAGDEKLLARAATKRDDAIASAEAKRDKIRTEHGAEALGGTTGRGAQGDNNNA